MDFYEASSKLGELIKSDEFYDAGLAIQFFTQAMLDGETPKMALALVKQHFDRTVSPEQCAKSIIRG